MINNKLYKSLLTITALFFIAYFCIKVIPPLTEKFDVIGAFGAGFVNPFSSAYAMDAICCWVVLFIWILYESPRVKYAWLCLLLGLMPGVAVGFALYLILRQNQFSNS